MGTSAENSTSRRTLWRRRGVAVSFTVQERRWNLPSETQSQRPRAREADLRRSQQGRSPALAEKMCFEVQQSAGRFYESGFMTAFLWERVL